MLFRSALFGHRGAALGLITGWGGTQRLPRLIGKARALQMFLATAASGMGRDDDASVARLYAKIGAAKLPE